MINLKKMITFIALTISCSFASFAIEAKEQDTPLATIKLRQTDSEVINVYSVCIKGTEFVTAIRSGKFRTEGQPVLIQVMSEENGGRPIRCKEN